MIRSKKISKEVWIGWISSLVEAYNMAIYSFIAPLLAPLLFPQSSASHALLFSYFLVFIASGVLYPAGALYYGFLGDREGRQRLCIYSTLGLGVATGIMGLLPLEVMSHGWIFFLLLIGAQYFFSGGEYHGSIVFSLEHSEDHSKGLMSSLSCLFAVFGLLAANGLATLSGVSQNQFLVRGCFLLGALGALISYLLKKYCRETPAFSSLTQDHFQPGGSFFKEEWGNILRVVSMLAFFIVIYNFIFIFLPLTQKDAQLSTFSSLMLYGIFLVLSGFLADKIGVRRTLLTGLLAFSLVLFPLILFSSLFATQMVLTMTASFVIGPIHSWALDQFPIARRCRGIFISSAIAISLFGGSTVPLCLMIFEDTNSLILCSLYPFTFGIFSFFCLFLRKDKKIITNL